MTDGAGARARDGDAARFQEHVRRDAKAFITPRGQRGGGNFRRCFTIDE